jgi:3-oxoacid CoA-transferase subunit B
MQHTNPKGESKLLPKFTLPLTGLACVKKVVTELAVLEITPDGFLLKETAPGVSIDEVKAKTLGRLIVAKDVEEMMI